MNDEHADELIPTRPTLLNRLRDLGDQTSWREFFEIYWQLIYRTAVKSGLRESEAQDVVQEVMRSVVKSIPTFIYDPALGSFKAWLLNLTRWRIADEFHKRQKAAENNVAPTDGTNPTAPIEKVPDPASLDLDAFWDTEWEKHVLEAAMSNVRRKLDPKRYQIWDLYVIKEWPAERVAATFGIDVSQVYLAKHRINELIREEAKRIEKEML